MNRSYRRSIFVMFLSLTVLCGLVSGVNIPAAEAQAPSEDSYEQNDSLTEASSIPSVVELPNMTIVPARDADFWRILAKPGDYRAQVIATPGLDLTLKLYGPDNSIIATHNDDAGPNAQIVWTVTSENYYVLEVGSETALEGYYLLRIQNITPTTTPIPTGTPTPTPVTPTATGQPTATSPFPTNTPTPDLGGTPDYTEPSYDFAHAYRIVPGDELRNLNFNSGAFGQHDNDFFVMGVRVGIAYTCETRDLSQSVDTNLILYWSANANDVIGGNDDINTQLSQINSRVTFTSIKEGDIYILAGYKYPETEDIPQPGAATYTLTCFAAQPTPTATAGSVSGGGTFSGSISTPVWIQLLTQPETTPTPTPEPINTVPIDLVIAYDKNGNREVDPTEGVAGVSVRIVDPTTNRELSHAFTDTTGTVHFIIPTNAPFRVTVPFLNMANDFRPGSPVQWAILIPASNAPGLIP